MDTKDILNEKGEHMIILFIQLMMIYVLLTQL